MKKETVLLLFSLICLAGSSVGLLVLVLIGFKYFSYQGKGLDWIYPASGILLMAWLVSAASSLVLLLKIALKSFRSVSIR